MKVLVRIHTHTHARARARARAYTHTHIHTHAHAHTYTHTHAHTIAHTRICTHIHAHVYFFIFYIIKQARENYICIVFKWPKLAIEVIAHALPIILVSLYAIGKRQINYSILPSFIAKLLNHLSLIKTEETI